MFKQWTERKRGKKLIFGRMNIHETTSVCRMLNGCFIEQINGFKIVSNACTSEIMENITPKNEKIVNFFTNFRHFLKSK